MTVWERVITGEVVASRVVHQDEHDYEKPAVCGHWSATGVLGGRGRPLSVPRTALSAKALGRFFSQKRHWQVLNSRARVASPTH